MTLFLYYNIYTFQCSCLKYFSDGIVLGDMGYSVVSFPAQFIQDIPVQQQQFVTEIVPETTTIYLDQSQVLYIFFI